MLRWTQSAAVITAIALTSAIFGIVENALPAEDRDHRGGGERATRRGGGGRGELEQGRSLRRMVRRPLATRSERSRSRSVSNRATARSPRLRSARRTPEKLVRGGGGGGGGGLGWSRGGGQIAVIGDAIVPVIVSGRGSEALVGIDPCQLGMWEFGVLAERCNDNRPDPARDSDCVPHHCTRRLCSCRRSSRRGEGAPLRGCGKVALEGGRRSGRQGSEATPGGGPIAGRRGSQWAATSG